VRVLIGFTHVFVATLVGFTRASSLIVSDELFTTVPTHPTTIDHPVHDAPIVIVPSSNQQAIEVPDTIDSIPTMSLQLVNATVTFVFIVMLDVTPGKSGTISSKKS
jgi:hypothetical protein